MPPKVSIVVPMLNAAKYLPACLGRLQPDWVRLWSVSWWTIAPLTRDCVILALASAPYDEQDYLRGYGQFLDYVGELSR